MSSCSVVAGGLPGPEAERGLSGEFISRISGGVIRIGADGSLVSDAERRGAVHVFDEDDRVGGSECGAGYLRAVSDGGVLAWI